MEKGFVNMPQQNAIFGATQTELSPPSLSEVVMDNFKMDIDLNKYLMFNHFNTIV